MAKRNLRPQSSSESKRNPSRNHSLSPRKRFLESLPVEMSSPCGTPVKFSLAMAVLAASMANLSAKSVLQVETVSAKANKCIWSKLDSPGKCV